MFGDVIEDFEVVFDVFCCFGVEMLVVIFGE